VPKTAPTNFDDLVQEITPTFSDDSGSVPILSGVVVPPDPSIDLPVALHIGSIIPSKMATSKQ
ncbi:hypothetical protein L195_g031571, partial [Trifolium pratense]